MLAAPKLNSIEILISKAVIDSNISHNQFVLINNALKIRPNCPLDIARVAKVYDRTQQFIEDSSLFI